MREEAPTRRNWRASLLRRREHREVTDLDTSRRRGPPPSNVSGVDWTGPCDRIGLTIDRMSQNVTGVTSDGLFVRLFHFIT